MSLCDRVGVPANDLALVHLRCLRCEDHARQTWALPTNADWLLVRCWSCGSTHMVVEADTKGAA